MVYKPLRMCWPTAQTYGFLFFFLNDDERIESVTRPDRRPVTSSHGRILLVYESTWYLYTNNVVQRSHKTHGPNLFLFQGSGPAFGGGEAKRDIRLGQWFQTFIFFFFLMPYDKILQNNFDWFFTWKIVGKTWFTKMWIYVDRRINGTEARGALTRHFRTRVDRQRPVKSRQRFFHQTYPLHFNPS